MRLAMTKAEREAFLADVHVGVISVAWPGRAPLTLPVWYAYEVGHELRFATGATSKKVHLIRAAQRISLCVQSETAPYKYVTVEGPVTLSTADVERDLRPIARRYLGEQMGNWYVQSTEAERARTGEILVRLRPERWLSVDYAKMSA